MGWSKLLNLPKFHDLSCLQKGRKANTWNELWVPKLMRMFKLKLKVATKERCPVAFKARKLMFLRRQFQKESSPRGKQGPTSWGINFPGNGAPELVQGLAVLQTILYKSGSRHWSSWTCRQGFPHDLPPKNLPCFHYSPRPCHPARSPHVHHPLAPCHTPYAPARPISLMLMRRLMQEFKHSQPLVPVPTHCPWPRFWEIRTTASHSPTFGWLPWF